MAKILVVDDSWLIRQTVVKYLTKAGHTVIIAENGQQGIEKTISEQPDCIVLDLLMPDMSGLDLLGKFKEKGITIPVCILTADIQTTTQERCKIAGAVDFICKPPNEENLIYKISLALQKGKVTP